MADLLGSPTDCSICTDEFTNPKLLPCGHTFCCQCLQDLYSSQGGRGQVPCPLCRSTSSAPAGGFSRLPTNTHAVELVAMAQRLETKTTRVARLEEDLVTANTKLELNSTTLEEVSTELEEATDEIRRLDTEISETTASLNELRDRSSTVERLLRAQVEVQTDLAGNESRLRNQEVSKLKAEITDVQAKLTDSEGALQEVLDEKLQVDAELAETRTNFGELECRSSEIQKRLESQLIEQRAAEERELSIRNQEISTLVEKLSAANSLLVQKDNSLKKVVVKKLRLHTKLAEATTKSAELRDRSSKLETLLESRGKELSAAEARESCLRQQYWETVEQLRDAETRYGTASKEAERCRDRADDLEASVQNARRSCQNMREQLDQARVEHSHSVALHESEIRNLRDEVSELQRQREVGRLNQVQQEDYKQAHTEVIRLCFVLFVLLFLATTGAVLLLEEQTHTAVEARDKQVVACESMWQKLEEKTTKLSTARSEARSTLRLLTDCSQQLESRNQAVQVAEVQQRDVEKALRQCKQSEKVAEKAPKSVASTEAVSKCSRQLADAQAELKTQKAMAEHCSTGRLGEDDQQPKAAVEVPERNDARQRLKLMIPSLTECQNRLKEASSSQKISTKPLGECADRLKLALDGINELGQFGQKGCDDGKNSTKCSKCREDLLAASDEVGKKTKELSNCEKNVSEARHNVQLLTTRLSDQTSEVTKINIDLTKCEEKVATKSDAVRTKTKELKKCDQSLVKTQNELVLLNNRLYEEQSIHSNVVSNIKLRHKSEIEAAIFDQFRCQQQLDKAESNCEVQSPLRDAINKSLFVVLLVVVYVFSVPVPFSLLMMLADLSHRFQTFIGIRGRRVMYQLANRRPRYR